MVVCLLVGMVFEVGHQLVGGLFEPESQCVGHDFAEGIAVSDDDHVLVVVGGGRDA